jgi:5'-nucleotidase
MRILVTNDDGLHAAQLLPLIKWCQKLGEVTAFVPKVEQSGKSHSFNISAPFEVKQVELEPGITVWSVDSTPADCVRIAVLGLNQKFDLVISGVNRGLNMGADIMYSGTVAAASEAVNLGMQAIALSTGFQNYENATVELDRVWAFFQKNKLLEKGNFYNVNIPEKPKGFKITRQGGPFYSDDFLPEENNMYRPKGKPVWEDQFDDRIDTDAVMHGYISVSPMTIVRSDSNLIAQLQDLSE